MSATELNMDIKEEDELLFKRTVRKLIGSTFIVRQKYPKLFSFVSRDSNRRDISDYLRMIGFDLTVDDRAGIAMLIPFSGDEDTPGLKRANIYTFSNEQYHILLVLWEMYLEKLGYSENTVITMGELVDRLTVYKVESVNDSRGRLFKALDTFRRFDLIDYDKDDMSEDREIILYPSLQFGWDIEQFETVAMEYLNKNSDDLPEDEDDADSGEDILSEETEE